MRFVVTASALSLLTACGLAPMERPAEQARAELFGDTSHEGFIRCGTLEEDALAWDALYPNLAIENDPRLNGFARPGGGGGFQPHAGHNRV